MSPFLDPIPSQASYKEIPAFGGWPAFSHQNEGEHLKSQITYLEMASESTRHFSHVPRLAVTLLSPVSICVLFLAGCGDPTWSCRAADSAPAVRSGGPLGHGL